MKKSTITATASNLIDRTTHAQECLSIVNEFRASQQNAISASDVIKTGNAKVSALKKAVRELNETLAYEYYVATPALEVLKAGKAVPCMTIEIDEKTDAFILAPSVTYPTIHGMEGFLKPGTADSIDYLRRIAAYVCMEGMENRKHVLTGRVKTDKDGKPVMKKNGEVVYIDAPNKNTAAMIPQPEKITNTLVKNAMHELMKIVSDNAIDTTVPTPMMKDFGAQVIRRSGWGVRGLASQEHTGDVFLEYVWMLLNGKTRFTVNVD